MQKDDVIYRQAAIDVADYTDCTGLAIEDVKKVTDEVVKGLKQLPTAQPEQRWIMCSERLPEPLQEVLVTSTRGYVYTSRIVHGDFEYGGNVIAWMPLPEPWKEGEVNDAVGS